MYIGALHAVLDARGAIPKSSRASRNVARTVSIVGAMGAPSVVLSGAMGSPSIVLSQGAA